MEYPRHSAAVEWLAGDILVDLAKNSFSVYNSRPRGVLQRVWTTSPPSGSVASTFQLHPFINFMNGATYELCNKRDLCRKR